MLSHKDVTDTVVKIMVIALTALGVVVALALLAFAGFTLYDSTFLPTYTGDATVTCKRDAPAYTTVQLLPMSNGKTTTFMSVTTFHPESYSLCMQVEQDSTSVQVDPDTYTKATMGNRLPIQYSRGRVSRHVYLWRVIH